MAIAVCMCSATRGLGHQHQTNLSHLQRLWPAVAQQDAEAQGQGKASEDRQMAIGPNEVWAIPRRSVSIGERNLCPRSRSPGLCQGSAGPEIWGGSSVSQCQQAEEARAGGVSPVRVDVIGVPRVRADQPATPPVRSSGDTSRKVDVRAEGNATSINV